jgi:hypothetical protein
VHQMSKSGTEATVQWSHPRSAEDEAPPEKLQLRLTRFSVQWCKSLWWRDCGGGSGGAYKEGFVLVNKKSARSMIQETRKLGLGLLRSVRRKMCYRAILIWKVA